MLFSINALTSGEAVPPLCNKHLNRHVTKGLGAHVVRTVCWVGGLQARVRVMLNGRVSHHGRPLGNGDVIN